MEGGFGGSVEVATVEQTQPNKVNKKTNLTSKQRKQLEDESKNMDAILAKVSLRHTFGCTPSSLDCLLSYNSMSGDKDINDRLIFRVGKQICIYDPETAKQQFLSGRLKTVTNVLHCSVSLSSRYISICESVRFEKNGPGHAQASVFSLTTFSRLKTVTHQCNGEFICSSFSGDGKYLVTLNDGNEYQLIIWQWEKERTYKSISLQSKPTKMSVSPAQLQIAISGPQVLKCYSLGPDGALRSSSLLNPSKESETFLDHKWLPQSDTLHRLVTVSSSDLNIDGSRRQLIYIFEGADAPSGSVGPPINLEFRQTIIPRFETPNGCIVGLCTYSKGFALYGKEGYVSVYEKCDDKREPYYEIRGYTLEVTNFIGGAILPTEDRLILVSNEGRLVSVGIGQHDIPGEKDSDLATVVATDLFPGGFHDGSILATDIAFHRSVCVTIGSDSTLRIWNFETLKCELVHKFTSEGDPIGLAIHPSGFQVIVSFKEKVKLFNIYLDKLKLFQESVSKSLKELKFSNSGQYWAAASTINVMIYDTTTFTQILCFQGHMMAIKRIAWGPGDHYIFSAGADGNVYGWSLEQDHRIDVIASSNRSNSIQGLAIDGADTSLVGLNLQRIVGRTTVEWGGGGGSGGAGGGSGTGDGATSASSGALVGTTSAADPSSFVIGTYCAVISSQDGTMKFAEWKPPNIYDGKLNNPSRGSDDTSSNAITLHLAGGDAASSGATSGGANYMSVVIISTCKKFLYAGMSDGSLRVYEWPVKTHTPSYIEIQAHSSAVVDLRESPTGHILITASEDGSIFIHSILKGQLAALSGAGTSGGGDTSGSYDLYSSMAASASELGGFIYNSDTVQIAKDDMDDHIQEVYDQRKKIEEMNTKFAFEMHQSETSHNEEIKKLLDRHNSAMNLEKEKYENMQTKMETKLRELMSTLEAKGLEHVRLTAELENRYEHKLADQLDRYDKLGEEMELLKQRCDGLLIAERQEFDRQLSEIKNKSRRYEKKMTLEKKRLVDEKNTDEGSFKEILQQQEEEYEDELRQLIAAAESELRSERENITKLRTLVQTKNTKIDQLKKKLTELAKSATQRQNILIYERKERNKLQETIEHYKKNLLEREEALAEKEKTILELRSTTRTLENFRFVLDHRLQQLSAERGPITQHIEGLEAHIRTMYEELVEEFENKKEENLKSSEKELRITAMAHEVSLLRQDNRQKDILIATFRRELENVIGSFGQKELEIAVKQLYRKYVKGENLKVDIKPGGGGAGGGGGGGGGSEMVQMILNDEEDESEEEGDGGGGGGGGHLNTMKAIGGGGGGGLSGIDGMGATAGGGGGGGGGGGRGKSIKKAIIREIETELVENAKEAQRQRQFVERSAENLKHRLQSTKAEASRINRTRLNENSHLIFECNELRKEVKNLQRKLEISNQSLLDAQAQSLINSLAKGGTGTGAGGAGAGAGGGQLQQPLQDWDEGFSPTATTGAAGAGVGDGTDAYLPDPRARTPLGGIGGGMGGRGTQSAVHFASVTSASASAGHGLNHQHSAPKILQNIPTEKDMMSPTQQLQQTQTHGGGVAVLEAGSSGVCDPGAPIPRDYYKGAMTVEQRLLRKKDTQIQRLTKDLEALTGQLDEASRERSMQRTELSRLRGLLARSLTNTRPGSDPVTGTGGGAGATAGGATNKLRGRLLLSVGMDNAVRLNNSMTHADLTGYPSEQDLHDIAAYGSGSLKHPDDETISSKGSGVQMRLPIGIPKGRGKSSAKN